MGSGFGLYGYLPAICNLGFTPVILKTKKHKLEERFELAKYFGIPIYSNSVEDLHISTDAVVVATLPSTQSCVLRQLISTKDTGHFFLEKPLGINSRDGKELLQILDSSRYSFSIAYLFLWTEWFARLKRELSHSEEVTFHIIWEVQLSANSWKSKSEIGGGLLSFYCTHLFAMYIDLGFGVESTSLIVSENSIQVTGKRLDGKEIQSTIRYALEPHFQISQTYPVVEEVFNSETPFGEQNVKGILDNRILALQNYMSASLLSNNKDYLNLESGIRDFRIIGEEKF